jgi:predicted dehydrogenase
MDKIRFAILGPGAISVDIANTVSKMECVEMYAVGSRDKARAEKFASEHGFKRSYGSYGEMLSDPDVELVYIATPISCHREHITACLASGKHVLCEKAFTINAAEAREVCALSRDKKLLLAEAIWPRYMPMASTIRELVSSGKIGKPLALMANLCYPVWHLERLREPKLGGGCLLDIGVYPLTFASIAFGDNVKKITASAMMSDTGVDAQDYILLEYEDGKTANLYASAVNPSDRNGVIYGETGYAIVGNVNNYEGIHIFDNDNREVEAICRPLQITGYEYEIQAAVDAIRSGVVECEQMPHSETIYMMELMDKIRSIWGLKFPMEK